jgi:F420-dependent oxidoreductase-like protein
MNIGVFIDTQSVDGVVGRVKVFGVDALTVLAVAGREVPDIPLGTAVVPTYPRHPMVLAQQAVTTQQATSGRLTLGIGLSHQMVVENMWGISFEKPARHMEEYLSVLMPLLKEGNIQFTGETIKAMGQLQIRDAGAPPSVCVAALGPKMLSLAGSLADGTITWMTGPKTVGAHIAPRITEAADKAERESPRIIVGLPVAITDDESAARETAAKVFSIYGQLPSYRAMLDREGAGGPADVAIVGDEASVLAQIEEVFAQGATEFMVAPFVEPQRTLEAVAKLL